MMDRIDFMEVGFSLTIEDRRKVFNKVLIDFLYLLPYENDFINQFISVVNSIDKCNSKNIHLSIIDFNKIEISIFFDGIINENFDFESIYKKMPACGYIIFNIRGNMVYLSIGMNIKLKDKINLPLLRRFIFNRLFENEYIEYARKVAYYTNLRICITEIDVIDISYKYEYITQNPNHYHTTYTFKAIPTFQDKKLKEMFKKHFEIKEFHNVRFNKIHEVIKGYLQAKENMPFKLLRKAINLKYLYYLLS